MKKAIALLVICFMALGVLSVKADTRDDSLGLTAGQQTDGLDSVWMFPQDASSFGNVVDLRLGDPNGSHYGDWGGILHKDFEDIGYFGIYTNRPFNQSDNIGHSTNAANQNGILNGWNGWAFQINPSNYNWNGSNYLGDPGNYNTGSAHYQYWPYLENSALNYYVDSYLGWNVQLVKVADPTNKVDLFWAKDFSDVTLGAHVNYANQSGGDAEYANGNGSGTSGITQGTPTLNGQLTSTFNMDSSVIGVDLGLTLKEIASNTSLALGLGYSLGSVNYKEVYNQNYVTTGTLTPYLNEAIKDNNISEIRVNALLKNKMNDTTTGRIYANVRLDNLGFTNNVQADDSNDGTFGDTAGEVFVGTSTYTDTNINVGLACDHVVADGKAKVIAGLGIIMDSRKWSQTGLNNLAGSTSATQVVAGSGSTYNEDWWVLPLNVAIEAPVFNWLTSRIGVSKNLYNNISAKLVQLTTPNAGGTAFTDTFTASNAWDMDSSINLTYGLSAKTGNFTFDVQLNPGALLNAAQSFEPGAGLLYGANNVNNSLSGGNSGFSQLFGTIMQADARFAF